MKERLEEIYQALDKQRDSWCDLRNGLNHIFPKSSSNETTGNLTEAGQLIANALSMCIADMYGILKMIENLKKEV